MKPLEIHGLAPDADCLHCQIAGAVAIALAKNNPAQVTGELLQVVGEVIASTAFSARDLHRQVFEAGLQLARLTRDARENFEAAGRLRS
jgi:hypothetical protein